MTNYIRSTVQQAYGLAYNTSVSSWNRYRNLGLKGKAFVWFLIILHILLIGIFVIIGPSQIFQTLYNAASTLREMRLGWLLIASIMVVTSFPPLIGYSTSLTVCGFAWGIKGFLIVAPSSIIGSALTFIVLRTLFKKRITSWTRQNKKWQAMEEVVRARGLPLVILIRWCPLPWVYSNMFFASIESVSLLQFVTATVLFLPKLFLVVFIGAQVGELSDGEHRGQMSTTAKVLDALSIVFGIGIAIGTGLFVWRTTSEKIRHMEGLSEETDRLAADTLDDASAPLLNSVSQDSLAMLEDEQSAENPLDEVLDKLTGRTKSQNRGHSPDASNRV